jgi:quercetin dioxygenase-like cupin family protein
MALPPRNLGERPVTSVASDRRQFNRAAFLTCLSALAAGVSGPAAAGTPAAGASGRRDVIKQALPGEPPRDIIMVEVTYPPGAGSPPHLHANGVMAFVVSGAIASRVNDAPEQTYHAGDAWWEPPGAVHRVSRNASTTAPATLLAIYIAPRNAAPAALMKPL